MSSIRYDKDAEGIVTLTLDAPGAPVNTMSAAFKAELAETVERLRAEGDALRGVILTSAKRTFFAGGDLKALVAITPDQAPTFFAGIERLKASLRSLETLGRPVVAAINGSALGGGLELALSCHARFCLDDPRIEIGLPEATLGLLPGAGGVVKTVRLMGLQAALPLLTEGRRLNPAQALQAGWLHGLAADGAELLAQARRWIGANPQPRQPWDDPKHRIPGGTPADPALAGMLAVIPSMLHEKTRGNFPAQEAVLSVAVEGAQVDFETALRIESRHLARLAAGQVAKNMIGTLFFQLNEVKAGKSRPAGPPSWRATKVGILGAGMMGAGIAWACANRGIACVLKDVSLDKAQAGKAHSERLLAERTTKGRVGPEQAQRTLALIQPTADMADLRDCDLVIEAVFEDRALKAAVTREAQQVLPADTLFASNTSTLPITGLAKASQQPERFIGLHFFSPVDRMQLVEIIRGRQTSDETLARAYDFVLQIGKTPIVVNDARGFYTSRVFGTFVNEGMALLGEGVPAAIIENAGWQTGMPVGPLAVLDEVSLKLADDVL
ncbi:MAG: 3-hydroxyacyl-CoA dehydrogenase NAD-binding domain-containing protein, partial [Burkholderiaceae bacterium]